jgi:hypothetical protein
VSRGTDGGEKPEEEIHLGYLDVDGRIILK